MWGHGKSEPKRPAAQEESESPGNEHGDVVTDTRAESGEEIIAFVGKGVEFKGTISYNGTVRIDGLLEGEIHTEGNLLVGEAAVITAKVSAGMVVCKGKITGDIEAKEKVKLRAPAVINGSVKTPLLSMEEGVLFNGTLEMTQPAIREVPRETTLHSIASSSKAVRTG